MYQLCVENALGELYDLTNRKNEYRILSVQGLTVPKIKVNTKEFAGFDGSVYNSSKVSERNIVINILLCGDIEVSRQRLYRIFLIKRELTIYFKNKYRSLKIKGYPESIDGDLFVKNEQMQISIICPKPYFESEYPLEAELSDIVNGFEFPFSIRESGIPISEIYDYPIIVLNNPGDVTCGAVIEIEFLKDCRIPRITNLFTNQFFELNGYFNKGDKVTISTIPGQFYIRHYFSYTNSEIGILDKLTANSDWLEVLPGRNFFKYESAGENTVYNVKVKLKISPLYGGV